MRNKRARQSVPTLSDPAIFQNTSLIGFSFTLWADGSPGLCNTNIADKMKKAMVKAKQALKSPDDPKPWVGMQWEIYDALEEMNDSHFMLSEFVDPSHIVPPPPFEAADILNPK